MMVVYFIAIKWLYEQNLFHVFIDYMKIYEKKV